METMAANRPRALLITFELGVRVESSNLSLSPTPPPLPTCFLPCHPPTYTAISLSAHFPAHRQTAMRRCIKRWSSSRALLGHAQGDGSSAACTPAADSPSPLTHARACVRARISFCWQKLHGRHTASTGVFGLVSIVQQTTRMKGAACLHRHVLCTHASACALQRGAGDFPLRACG